MEDQARVSEFMMEQVDENDVPVAKVYECTQCDRSFRSSQALAGHCKSHYYRKDHRLQRNPAPPPAPKPVQQQQQQQTALSQPTTMYEYQSFSDPNGPYVPALTDQLPHATYGYEPVTYSTRVTPIRGGLDIENYGHGSSANDSGEGSEPSEGNNEELDLTLRLGRNW